MQLVISDACLGSESTVEYFREVGWQRCADHFTACKIPTVSSNTLLSKTIELGARHRDSQSNAT